MIFAVKIIDLDAKLSAKKEMVAIVFKIDGGSIYRAIVSLMNQGITVLILIIIEVSEIWCYEIILFLLVFCLANVVIKV